APLSGLQGSVSRVAFAPDGRTLAVATSFLDLPLVGGLLGAPGPSEAEATNLLGNFRGRVYLYDPLTGKKRATLPEQTGAVSCLAFAPDGTTLAAGFLSTWDLPSFRDQFAGRSEVVSRPGSVKLWDAGTGQERAALESREGVWALAFAPDGKALALAAGPFGEVQRWDPRTRRGRVTGRGHTAPVHALAFAPGGAGLLSAGQDGTVRAWDWGGSIGPVLWQDHLPFGAAEGLTFSPDGRFLVLSGGGRAVLLNL